MVPNDVVEAFAKDLFFSAEQPFLTTGSAG
jgi:hypothetical protein